MSEIASGTGSAAPAAASSEAAPASADNSTISNSPQPAEGISQAQQAEIQEAIDNGDSKEAQRLIKKYDLKVRGKTISKEIDLSDDDYIRNQLQLAEVSKQSMQESAELKKAYQKELERFRANPWQVLEELGLNPDALAEERIQQRIEEMQKSPEQIKAEQRERELLEAREEAKRLREEKESLEMQKLQEQASIQLKDEISKAIANKTTLPNNQYVEKRVADTMLWAMNNGFDDVTAEDVVLAVEQEMKQELAQLYEQMPEDVIEQFIGKKNIERMRKRRVAQVRQAPSVNDIKQTTSAAKAAQDASARAKQPVRSRDFFKNLGKQK
jgi:hypothetical protein